MDDSEEKIATTRGKYLYAIKDGWKQQDAGWARCRIVVTTKRIVVIGVEGEKLTVPFAEVDRFEDRCDVNQACRTEPEYLAARVGENVVLLVAEGTIGQPEFETDVYRGAINGRYLFVRHPAVDGGRVRRPGWTKGRIKVTDDELFIVLENGKTVTIDRSDVASVKTASATVDGTDRPVVRVEHSERERSVETDLATTAETTQFLRQLCEHDRDTHELAVDLEEREKRVLVGLYAGLEPEQLPDALGYRPDTVYEFGEEFEELDLIDWTDDGVRLTPRGRKLVHDVEYH